ncbi:hypothetical protein IJJ08_01680 [bacterium]|nr:hypothetical protein [bacterium]
MKNTNNPTHQQTPWASYALIGGIVIVTLIISVELINLLSRPMETLSTIAPSLNHSPPVTNNPTEEELVNFTAVAYSADIDPRQLETEVTQIMQALGIKHTDAAATVYTETDVEALSSQNVNQKIPPAGTYQATALFEQGVEKDLQALSQAGRTINIIIDENGGVTIDFLGLKFDAAADDHYLYLEDGSKMPYFWDGQTITAAAHRIELDLVRVQ